MATINKVSCFVNSSEQSAFFIAGCGNGSDYYFCNKYTRIPNEFNLFRPYFPKMLFTEIVEAVQRLMSIAGRYTGLSGDYSFQVGFDNGTEKTFWVSGKTIGIQIIDAFFHYNDFLDDIDSSNNHKKFLTTDTSTITLENVRSQIASGFVPLNMFFETRIETYGKNDFNSVTYDLVVGKNAAFSLQPRYSQNSALVVSVDEHGKIISDGCIPYIRLLKERNVKVTCSQQKQPYAIYPLVSREERVKLYDPAVLMYSGAASYDFANDDEYNLFLSHYQCDGKVTWTQSGEYAQKFCEAYDLFETEQFEQSMKVYLECLKINPIAIEVRFEIANCLVKLRKLTAAKKCLVVLGDILSVEKRHHSSEHSRFYRLLGYILCEEGRHVIAYSCYKYSLQIDWTETAVNEMIYIGNLLKQIPRNRSGDQLEDYFGFESLPTREHIKQLKENRIPIIDVDCIPPLFTWVYPDEMMINEIEIWEEVEEALRERENQKP